MMREPAYTPRRQAPFLHKGFTLIEMLVALALGSFLIAATLTIYGSSVTAYRHAENIADLEERLAFAMRAIERDVLLAGYWGLIHDGRWIDVPVGTRVHCSGIDVGAWALQLDVAIGAHNGNSGLPCPAYSASVAGSDGLTVRHLSALSFAPSVSDLQVHADQSCAALSADGSIPPCIGGHFETRNLAISGWYVDQQSSENDLPSLRRYTLVSSGLLQNQEIMPGIENLQILLGVDRDADAVIDGFVGPHEIGGADVLAVHITLQAVSADRDVGGAPLRASAERLFALRNYVPV